MKKKLTVSSSSYLIPNHYAWDKFNNFKINFKNSGNLSDGFFKSDLKVDLFIKIFLEDIFDREKLNYKDLFKTLKKLIFHRLNNSNAQTIIGLSSDKINNFSNFLISENKEIDNFQKLKNFFKDVKKKFPNLIIINYDEVFKFEGYNKVFDKRNYHLANSRFSSYGYEILTKNLLLIIDKINTAPKKLLILDCDNTLWGGILGEDGFDGIQIGQDGLGKAFYNFQKSILKLSRNGTLLAISSKNNYKDVERVFKKHSSMILKYKDIVSFKVNWKEKYLNIQEISQDLNIGLDSVVFWDDNPLERQKIKNNLKDVTVIEPSIDPSNWQKELESLSIFDKLTITKEDKKKTNQYKIRAKFINNKNKIKDEIKYLKSIKLQPELLKLNKSNIDRAAQMTQKTNQFNLRTERYNLQNLLSLKKNKNFEIRLIKLKDIYGDHGIISMFILERLDSKSIFIDTMLLSCRVFGRYLETWIFNEIKKICKKNSISKIFCEYIQTEKNHIIKDMFADYGFKLVKNKSDFKFSRKNKIKGILYKCEVNKILNKRMNIYERK